MLLPFEKMSKIANLETNFFDKNLFLVSTQPQRELVLLFHKTMDMSQISQGNSEPLMHPFKRL